MKKLNPRIEHELTAHMAEIYHKGSTYIPLFKLLHWFDKDGGKITQAFFRREIFSRWQNYLEVDDHTEEFPLSVLSVLSDHSVKKAEGYTIFNTRYLYIDSSDEQEYVEEDE
ncbi:hypothetical protein [Atlantibacter sp.]|uniref:hypothetical protein n=1 Tax=Atlantibacter sp. TaxID=1903473 RepID=UPI002898E762|nr:hypothetical protein [Atlantibacter sp.]